MITIREVESEKVAAIFEINYQRVGDKFPDFVVECHEEKDIDQFLQFLDQLATWTELEIKHGGDGISHILGIQELTDDFFIELSRELSKSHPAHIIFDPSWIRLNTFSFYLTREDGTCVFFVSTQDEQSWVKSNLTKVRKIE